MAKARRAYEVHYNMVQYGGDFTSRVLVVANDKEAAKRKFKSFVANYPWPPEVKGIEFVKVGALFMVVV